MRISIICSDCNHPVFPYLQSWVSEKSSAHLVELVNSKSGLSGGDILFLISCNELISINIRKKYKASLIIHASDLPRGRGWSPHIWQILQGKNSITVTLLEAEDKVDSGAIWTQKVLRLEGHELYDEINKKLFQIELELMEFAAVNFGEIYPRPQSQGKATYFKKRNPEDSRLDTNKTVEEQFNLLRVADPNRFPAFFDHAGYRYELFIKKIKNLSE